MKIIEAALTGLCVSVTAALLSLASADAVNSTQGGGSSITCKAKGQESARVSQPNTNVTVTCTHPLTLDPTPEGKGSDNIYLDAECSKPGLLSSVCPGATVTKVGKTRNSDTTVNVFFSQLPSSQQVVCLRCKENGNGESDCLAMITVAPASPRGPQVCAGRGSSVTLRIDEAGGSAQFACGKDLPALEPVDVTKAYADDCTSQETLKDVSRSTATETYVTFTVEKLKKKRLCYLCKPSAGGGGGKEMAKDESCKIYVEVSGSTRSSSSVHFGFALPCLAAMLRFT